MLSDPLWSLDWFARESVTIPDSATALTAATYNVSTRPHARVALITVEDAQISFTLDGTTPTATVGHLADIGDTITLRNSNEVNRFQAIRTGSTSGTLKVSYAR